MNASSAGHVEELLDCTSDPAGPIGAQILLEKELLRVGEGPFAAHHVLPAALSKGRWRKSQLWDERQSCCIKITKDMLIIRSFQFLCYEETRRTAHRHAHRMPSIAFPLASCM
jgi:hypothetical protein